MLLPGYRNDASPRIERVVCYGEHANCGEGPGAAEIRCRCVRYAPSGHPEPRGPTRPASGGGATPWHARRRSRGSPITGELARVVDCESMIRAWCADPGSSADGALSSWRRVDHEGHRPPVISCRPMAFTALRRVEPAVPGRRPGRGRGRAPVRRCGRTNHRRSVNEPRPGAGTPRDVGGRTAHPARMTRDPRARAHPSGGAARRRPGSLPAAWRAGDQRWPRCPALTG